MMILRSTNKALKKFGQKSQDITVNKSESYFGDWYVNTADSFNKGNLFVPVMHSDSLYTMLLPIEKGIDVSNFVHCVFANLMLRMMRLEIPQECADRLIKSYGGQAIFAKTSSRSILGNLNVAIREIETMVEYCDDVSHGKTLDLVRLEYKTNDTPRKLNGKTVWPLDTFYSCIRQMCPELPQRMPLPIRMLTRQESVIVTAIFRDRVPEQLLIKIQGASIGAEVLFNYMEVQALLKALAGSQKQTSNIPERIYSDLNRTLNFKAEELSEGA